MSRGAPQHLRQIHQQQQNATQKQKQESEKSKLFVVLYLQIFRNDFRFTTDGQQNQTSHEKGTGTAY